MIATSCGATVTYQKEGTYDVKQQTYMRLHLSLSDILGLLFSKYRTITVSFEHDPKPHSERHNIRVENFTNTPLDFAIKEKINANG
jgi:hypothetical protein